MGHYSSASSNAGNILVVSFILVVGFTFALLVIRVSVPGSLFVLSLELLLLEQLLLSLEALNLANFGLEGIFNEIYYIYLFFTLKLCIRCNYFNEILIHILIYKIMWFQARLWSTNKVILPLLRRVLEAWNWSRRPSWCWWTSASSLRPYFQCWWRLASWSLPPSQHCWTPASWSRPPFRYWKTLASSTRHRSLWWSPRAAGSCAQCQRQGPFPLLKQHCAGLRIWFYLLPSSLAACGRSPLVFSEIIIIIFKNYLTLIHNISTANTIIMIF